MSLRDQSILMIFFKFYFYICYMATAARSTNNHVNKDESYDLTGKVCL